jgi:hypothetical protein
MLSTGVTAPTKGESEQQSNRITRPGRLPCGSLMNTIGWRVLPKSDQRLRVLRIDGPVYGHAVMPLMAATTTTAA